jgi:hypothetical protein
LQAPVAALKSPSLAEDVIVAKANIAMSSSIP